MVPRRLIPFLAVASIVLIGVPAGGPAGGPAVPTTNAGAEYVIVMRSKENSKTYKIGKVGQAHMVKRLTRGCIA